MTCTATTNRYVPESTWFTLTGITLQFTIAVTLLATSASVFAVSVGDPDGVAVIALVAIVAIVLGLTLTHAFEHCRVHGIPLVE